MAEDELAEASVVAEAAGGCGRSSLWMVRQLHSRLSRQKSEVDDEIVSRSDVEGCFSSPKSMSEAAAVSL